MRISGKATIGIAAVVVVGAAAFLIGPRPDREARTSDAVVAESRSIPGPIR